MKHSIFIVCNLALLGSVLAYGGLKSPARVIAQRLEQEPETVIQQQNKEYETPKVYYNPASAYQFGYSTGQPYSNGYNQQDVAQHFREEKRDASGYVTGKYGYIDPNGNLRVVNYRAGPDGYHAYGDIGPDQEAVKQQKLLYAYDQATRLQKDAWAKYQSSSSAKSLSSSSSSSDWTSINTGSNYGKSGGYKTARYYSTSAKSPAEALRDYSATSKNTIYSSASETIKSPEVVSKTTYTLPAVTKTQTYSRYVHRPAVVVPVKTRQYSYYYAIPAQQQSKTSRYSESKTSYPGNTAAYQSPAAKLIEISRQQQKQKSFTDADFASSASSTSASSASSAASSAAASAASASASASSAASASAGSSSAFNDYKASESQKQQVSSSRYTNNRSGHSVVNFKSFGPSPYQYSYSF